MTFLKKFFNDEEGQDLVEYALLLGFVALAATAALTTLGGDLNTMYGKISTKVSAGS